MVKYNIIPAQCQAKRCDLNASEGTVGRVSMWLYGDHH
jgi:hypothetical protein